MWQDEVNNYLDVEGLKKVEFTLATTKAAVRSQLLEGVEAGEGIEKLARRISGTNFADINRKRARVIARTEVIGASNRGQMAGARSLGVPLEKEWVATVDSVTRDSHREADGDTVPMEEPFIIGDERSEMMQPGDPSAPAAEVINCRCTVSFERIKDSAEAIARPVVRPTPAPVATPTVAPAEFVPAKTVKEAIAVAETYAESVEMPGVTLAQLNAINKGILRTLGGSIPDKRVTALRWQKAGIKNPASYLYETAGGLGGQSIEGGKDWIQVQKTFARNADKKAQQIREVFTAQTQRNIQRNIDTINDSRIPEAAKGQYRAYLAADQQALDAGYAVGYRATVEPLEAAMSHEAGHLIYVRNKSVKARWDTAHRKLPPEDFAKVSQYATSSAAEYFAEANSARSLGLDATLPISVRSALDDALSALED
jgi:hypothetical protein